MRKGGRVCVCVVGVCPSNVITGMQSALERFKIRTIRAGVLPARIR